MNPERGIALVLRPATFSDEKFANDLLFATMHEYVETSWPGDEAAQQQYYAINGFNPGNTRIVLVDGKPVGRLSMTIKRDCIFIDELHITPEYQRKGIGEQVIKEVLSEAKQRGLDVGLTVLEANPARNLYLRMGFRPIALKDHRIHMWRSESWKRR